MPHNGIFEIVNGAWSILSTAFVVFLLVHIKLEASFRKLTWRDWFSLPPGMQVAVAMLVYDSGTALSRIVAWAWRYETKGLLPLTETQTLLLIIGATIASLGLLCQIRVFTRPYMGHWAWMAAAGLVLIYIALRVAI